MVMKRYLLTAFLLFALLTSAACVQAPSPYGFSVSSITGVPQEAMVPGTPVNASFKINITEQYHIDQDLLVYTDVANPVWNYTVIVNGVENVRQPVAGQTLDISGFEVNYRSTDQVSVRVALTGTVPAASSGTAMTIFRVTELNPKGNPITGTQIERTGTVVNNGSVTPATVAARSTRLPLIPTLSTGTI